LAELPDFETLTKNIQLPSLSDLPEQPPMPT